MYLAASGVGETVDAHLGHIVLMASWPVVFVAIQLRRRAGAPGRHARPPTPPLGWGAAAVVVEAGLVAGAVADRTLGQVRAPVTDVLVVVPVLTLAGIAAARRCRGIVPVVLLSLVLQAALRAGLVGLALATAPRRASASGTRATWADLLFCHTPARPPTTAQIDAQLASYGLTSNSPLPAGGRAATGWTQLVGGGETWLLLAVHVAAALTLGLVAAWARRQPLTVTSKHSAAGSSTHPGESARSGRLRRVAVGRPAASRRGNGARQVCSDGRSPS